VVDEMEVEKDPPVPNNVPPDGAEYHLMVPAEAVAPSTSVPGPQRVSAVVPVIVGIIFIVAVTPVLVGVVSPLAVAST
jgi:hypothetical protein